MILHYLCWNLIKLGQKEKHPWRSITIAPPHQQTQLNSCTAASLTSPTHRHLHREGWSSQSILKEISLGIFIGRTNAEAPILWPPDAKSWLIGKDSDAGKDWRQEKGVTEEEMIGWHYWLNGLEFWANSRMIVKDREVWHAAVHGVVKS